MIRVEVIRAWPRRHQTVALELPDGTTVGAAIAASGLATEDIAGIAVFGERADIGDALRDGDRVELLRALSIDPKAARRLRAERQRPRK